MNVISAGEFRNNTAKTLNRVAYGGERVVLGRRGEPLAALVSMEDLQLLEEMEERLDVEAFRKAKKAFKKSGKTAIPWSQAKKELGLE